MYTQIEKALLEAEIYQTEEVALIDAQENIDHITDLYTDLLD